MSRYHGLTKEATQRLLDLAVEDNLIKLENKIGTKGNKSGIEEKAYRLPTADMLPRWPILNFCLAVFCSLLYLLGCKKGF